MSTTMDDTQSRMERVSGKLGKLLKTNGKLLGYI